MPNTTSAKKRLRQDTVRRLRNRASKSAMRTQVRKVRGVEHGAFDARSFVVPAARGVFDSSDTGKADPDPASHRRFQRDLAGRAAAGSEVGDGLHHHLGTAAHDPVRQAILVQDLFEYVGNQTPATATAVVGRQAHVDSQSLKILDTGQHVSRARAITQRHPVRPHDLTRWSPVLPMSQKLGRQGQERGLTDASGHHDQMLDRLDRKTIPQRPPDIQLLTGDHVGQTARKLSFGQVHHIDPG
jgi:hypothetical protein